MIRGKRSRNYLWMEGDSGVAGGGIPNYGLFSQLRALGYPITSTALSGSTMTSVRDRVVANAHLVSQCLPVMWDFQANSYGSVSGYLGLIDTIIGVTGTRMMFIPPINVGPAGSELFPTSDMVAIANGIAARGVATFDPITVLAPLNNGSPGDLADVAAGICPRSLLATDMIHLGLIGLNAVAQKVDTDLISLGWKQT